MDKNKKPSRALNLKQRQERKESIQKLPKIVKFFTQPSTSSFVSNISVGSDSESDKVTPSVLVEKPTQEDWIVKAVKDAVVDHINEHDICMCISQDSQVTAEESSISSFFENVNDQSSYDSGNFTNKILSETEKRQILDMRPLQPLGPFPTDAH
ncbi:hypothetical protein HHI36_005409 [Cryptolaemus montrouzieri]|uniref:Uncharacterized protein n=1 Tax=Cryptolaemus montrouzieri TaxID=559131 RepID=A0ABD2NVL7_9CUCU